MVIEDAPGTSAGEGANQISSSFSGPSNGAELEKGSATASMCFMDGGEMIKRSSGAGVVLYGASPRGVGASKANCEK